MPVVAGTQAASEDPKSKPKSKEGDLIHDDPIKGTQKHTPSVLNTSSPHFIWLLLPFVITFLHVVLSPYTKVEETPALHAVYDHLTHSLSPGSLLQYEHVVYPGPVPRSFIPSLLVAGATKPLAEAGKAIGIIKTGLQVQILLRLVLAFLFSTSLSHLTTTLHRMCSPMTARAYVLLLITQFHVMYYAGRTLPNFLALPPVVLAFSLILRGTYSSPVNSHLTEKQLPVIPATPRKITYSVGVGLALMTFTATDVRLEIAPLAVSLALVLVLQSHLSFIQALLSGAAGGFTGLILTATVDQHFYTPTAHPYAWWPELSAFAFNIAQGKSSEWGVSPVYTYILNLPKLLLFSLPLSFYRLGSVILRGSEVERRRTALIVFPSAAIVAVLSMVGHKEWRFIVYVVPLLNILGAEQASEWWHARSTSWRLILRLFLIGGIVANIAVTALMTLVSRHNYPGGQIGPLLEQVSLTHSPSGKVWIPAAALHSGTTLFTLPPTVLLSSYASPISLEEGLNLVGNLTIVRPESGYEASAHPSGNTPAELWEEGYDWVVSDDWESFVALRAGEDDAKVRWRVIEEIEGLKGVRRATRWPFLWIEMAPRLAILERVDERETGKTGV